MNTRQLQEKELNNQLTRTGLNSSYNKQPLVRIHRPGSVILRQLGDARFGPQRKSIVIRPRCTTVRFPPSIFSFGYCTQKQICMNPAEAEFNIDQQISEDFL
jgi:hypothetical protein